MPFDGLVTNQVVRELSRNLTSAKINKIYMPTKTEIILTMRIQRKNVNLLVSAHPSYARLHLLKERPTNPSEPPMFCMVLRKHLTGAVIQKIEQINHDRIIHIQFQTINEIGDKSSKSLYIEIMGRHSNISLVNDSNMKIIDCIKHVPPFQNRYRALLPGADYILPPAQNKLVLTEHKATEIVNRLDFNAGKMASQLVKTINGISKIVGEEIVFRAHLGNAQKYTDVIEKIQEECKNSQNAYLYHSPKEDYHVLKLTHLEVEKTYDNLNSLLDDFYLNKAEKDRIHQQMKQVIKQISQIYDKNKKKLKIHQNTLRQSKEKEKWKKYGELLTANLYQVKQGDESLTTIDFYDPNQAEITIKLDPVKAPSDNAQAFFKKYRKLIAAEKRAQIEINKTVAEMDYLENILRQFEQASWDDVADIKTELEDGGYLKKQKHKRIKKQKPKPEQYETPDGTLIYVGKNNKQNEYVTHQIAHKEDVWLHTLNIPGSHVVVKDSDPSEETLILAATLAAYFSKARQSASVPVDYTKVKHVKKPSGGKPGFVTYTHQKTIDITPSASTLNTLKKLK